MASYKSIWEYMNYLFMTMTLRLTQNNDFRNCKLIIELQLLYLTGLDQFSSQCHSILFCALMF